MLASNYNGLGPSEILPLETSVTPLFKVNLSKTFSVLS